MDATACIDTLFSSDTMYEDLVANERDHISGAEEPCFWCFGTGLIDDGWADGYVSCEPCNGTGVKP